ncbi:MAG: 50S ribosomal protein L30 [Gemmatimonadetes bacterium]|nr:50S ribosomal protein L30 [Gemmatimonadota bacterium]
MAKKAAAKKAKGPPAKLAITQVRSGIGRPKPHRLTLRALGFTHHQQTLIHNDNPAIRGMIEQVKHLVSVRPVEE